MNSTDILARLARACAHGTRQLEFVNELLAGEGYIVQVPCGFSRMGYYVKVGDSGLGYKSWLSLRKRLIANGFMIKMTEYDKQNRREVKLSFSV